MLSIIPQATRYRSLLLQLLFATSLKWRYLHTGPVRGEVRPPVNLPSFNRVRLRLPALSQPQLWEFKERGKRRLLPTEMLPLNFNTLPNTRRPLFFTFSEHRRRPTRHRPREFHVSCPLFITSNFYQGVHWQLISNVHLNANGNRRQENTPERHHDRPTRALSMHRHIIRTLYQQEIPRPPILWERLPITRLRQPMLQTNKRRRPRAKERRAVRPKASMRPVSR